MDITRCYFETIGKLIFEELNEVSDTNSILFKKKKKNLNNCKLSLSISENSKRVWNIE